MTVEEQKSFLTREYAEANRYIDNAKEALAKSKKDKYHYDDKKYVRSACGIAYSGVLVALDAWLTVKGVDAPRGKQKKRKSIEYYMTNVAGLDRKLMTYLQTAYNALHLDGYYDGITSVKVIEAGFENARLIINKIKPTAA